MLGVDCGKCGRRRNAGVVRLLDSVRCTKVVGSIREAKKLSWDRA